MNGQDGVEHHVPTMTGAELLSAEIWARVRALCAGDGGVREPNSAAAPEPATVWVALLRGTYTTEPRVTTLQRRIRDLVQRLQDDAARQSDAVPSQAAAWVRMLKAVGEHHVARHSDEQLCVKLERQATTPGFTEQVARWDAQFVARALDALGERPSSLASVFGFARAVLAASGADAAVTEAFESARAQKYAPELERLGCAEHALGSVAAVATFVARALARSLLGLPGRPWPDVPSHPVHCRHRPISSFRTVLQTAGSPVDYAVMATLTVAALRAHADASFGQTIDIESDQDEQEEEEEVKLSWPAAPRVSAARRLWAEWRAALAAAPSLDALRKLERVAPFAQFCARQVADAVRAPLLMRSRRPPEDHPCGGKYSAAAVLARRSVSLAAPEPSAPPLATRVLSDVTRKRTKGCKRRRPASAAASTHVAVSVPRERKRRRTTPAAPPDAEAHVTDGPTAHHILPPPMSRSSPSWPPRLSPKAAPVSVGLTNDHEDRLFAALAQLQMGTLSRREDRLVFAPSAKFLGCSPLTRIAFLHAVARVASRPSPPSASPKPPTPHMLPAPLSDSLPLSQS